MSTITNNKLTDERPDDECLELLITIRREIAERHASEGRMEQCAVHTLILNALLELQERRKADSARPVAYTTDFYVRELDKSGLYQCWLSRDARNAEYNVPLFAAPQSVLPPPEMPAHTGPRQEGRPQAYVDGWNACRDATLQSFGNSEQLNQAPVKQPSNAEQVADLYALYWKSGEVVTYTPNPEKATIWLNNYSGTCVQEYVKLERLQEALAGNSPVIPDGWISCSERMPEMGERQCYVLAADFKNNYPPNTPNTQVGVYGDWFNDGNPTWDDGDGEDLYLKEVTHWMPLPAPPQEVK